jgi:hypothetical protein
MPLFAWIALGLLAWTLCGVLAIAIALAARRGDCLSPEALMGMDPNVELAPRTRMAVDVTPVARPWVAAGAGTPAVAPALAEAGGPRS